MAGGLSAHTKGRNRTGYYGQRVPLGRPAGKAPALTTGVTRVTIRPIIEGPQESREIDEMLALIERAFQSLIPYMSNVEIIEKAKRLDIELRQESSSKGPQEKSAIAETLIKMFETMDQRIKAAPLDNTGLPKLPGVPWKKNDPLAGIVEGISPFHMHEWWRTYLIKSQPQTPSRRSARQRPRREESRASPPSPSPPSPPSSSLPPPSLGEAIRRAKKALQSGIRIPDLGPQSRMLCVLKKIGNPTGNAWYISEAGIKYLMYYNQDLINSRIRMIVKDTLPTRERDKLNRFDPGWKSKMYTGSTLQRHLYVIKLARYLTEPIFMQYWRGKGSLWSGDARRYIKEIVAKRGDSDRNILYGLRQLNMDIMSAFSWFRRAGARYTLGGGSSQGLPVRLIRARINRLQNTSTAVLSCYK
ncbi:MAG: hypothetical protein D6736_17980 [Nitrospinota bacterium]|nr:MAG: hypothetical protein D6736_17980 [Nitrospinota bacterium]